MGRLARFAATLVLALGLGAPAASAVAAPTAIDPACSVFDVSGIVAVGDPAELDPSTLPSQVPVDGMSCVLDFPTVAQSIYAYLTDPFPTFLEIVSGFDEAGYSIEEYVTDDSASPVDLTELSGRSGDGEINIVVRSGGLPIAGIYYATDDAAATFGVGTFIAVTPVAPTNSDTGIEDPSAISDLRTIGDAVPTPAQGGVLIVSAALLTLLLAIPAFLLSRVLSARYTTWFGWLERGRIGRWREELAKPKNSARRWLLLGIGAVLAALISGFIDPRFGFNGLSVRLFVTLLATFALFNIGAWAVVTLVLRRVQPDARPALTFHPASLLVVAIAVLLSRLLDFDPGVVFGLVAGTTFAVTLALSKEAIVIIAGSAYAAVIAVVAWVGYSVLTSLNPLDGFSVGLTELLGGITIEGVSTLPIALVPLATLDGGILFRWKRWVWAAAYAVGLALFMLVLFTLPGGDAPADGDFVRWVLVFVVFAVIATGVWLVDYLTTRKTSADTTA
jgi:hypothetical protein